MLLAVLTSTFIDANQGAVQRWQEAKPMHETGVVSRVPCRSRLPRQTGRTATLTGQAAHTSSTVTTRRQQDSMIQIDEETMAVTAQTSSVDPAAGQSRSRVNLGQAVSSADSHNRCAGAMGTYRRYPCMVAPFCPRRRVGGASHARIARRGGKRLTPGRQF